MRKKGLLIKSLIFVMITLLVQVSIIPNIPCRTSLNVTEKLNSDSSFHVGEIIITSHGDESTCVCKATAVKDVSVPVDSNGETIDFRCWFDINITGLFDHATASLTVNDVLSDNNETDDTASGYLHCPRVCNRGDVVIWVLVADLIDLTFEQQERHFVSNGGGLCDLTANPFWFHFLTRLQKLSLNPFWLTFFNRLIGHFMGLQRNTHPVVLASGVIHCV